MKRAPVKEDRLLRLLITAIFLLYNNNVFAIRPTFTSTFYEVSVKEDAQICHVLLHSLEANTNNVTTKYSLVGEQSQDFSITPYGSLQVARPLDHEQKNHYELTIAGTSVTYPYETAYSLVAIDIEDVPDNYLVFEKAMYTDQTIKEIFFLFIFFSSLVLAIIIVMLRILRIQGNHPLINHGHDNPELEARRNEIQTELAYSYNRFTTTFKIN